MNSADFDQNSQSEITTKFVWVGKSDGAQESRYQLLRLILVDSYTPGRIVELPLIGGTAITGRNGRGKTSLLQLNSAFWGERPDRIVRSVSNKLNFARYYLPRATSFIVFEYRRDDVVCCSVMFADDSGDGVQYRFVRSPFLRELFVLDDGHSLLRSDTFAERMKIKGVYVTRKMALDEYRSVVQGKVGHGSDRAWQRQMISEFAFCPPNRSVQHIERIVSGMFMRETNFNDLQRMIIASVSDTETRLAINTERKKIESWPDAYESYLAVMQQEVRMESVQASYDGILSAEDELRRIHARFVVLDAHLENEVRRHEKEAQRIEGVLAEREKTYLQDKVGIQETIETSEREIRYREGEVARTQGKSNEYEQAGIAGKAALIEREAEISLSRRQLGERKQLLIGAQTNIDAEYQKIFSKIERDHLKILPQFDAKRAALREAHAHSMTTFGNQKDIRIAETNKAAESELQALQQRVDQANVSLGEASLLAKQPAADPALTGAWERQLAAVGEVRLRVTEADQESRQAAQAYAASKEEYAKTEKQLERMRRDAVQIEAQLMALRLHAAPGENSVLYRLRQERPNWTEDIAKVIREDLLTRTDLAPVIGAIGDGIYGLEVDLSRLDAPLAADETALRSQITTRQEELSTQLEQIGLQEMALARADEVRQTAERQAELISRELATVRTALSAAEELERAAKKAEVDSRNSAKSRADQALSLAQTEQRTCVGALLAFKQRLTASISEIETEHKSAVTSAQTQLAQELATVSTNEAAENTRYTTDRAAVEVERAGKLKAVGVDTDALQRLESEITYLDAQLDTITASRSLVSEWKVWQESEWSKMQGHVEALNKAKDQLKADRERKRQLDGAWFKERDDLMNQVAALAAQIKAIVIERGKVAVRCKPLEAYVPDSETLGLPFAPEWTLAALVGQANEQQRAVDSADLKLKEEIAALKAVFCRHRGSPQDSFAETHRQEMGPDRAANAREWVPVFKHWYGTVHEQYRKILGIDARQIASAISFFYDGMRSFHNKVNQFNRELQENLNANVGFESIGGVNIQIVSSIQELDYWEAIEQVAKCKVGWARNDESDLPPPELAPMLRDLLEHWQVREGIKADLTNLIRIQGEVVENGVRRPFKKAADLKEISSNGLSYIILVLIFIGFINRVRGDASINVVWALDELKDLDAGNVETLFDILSRNNITLICACPDPDPDTLSLFANRRSIRADRFIYDPRTLPPGKHDHAISEEAAHV